LRVIKKDGDRVNFDRANIKSGLVKACFKRPVSSDAIDNLVGAVENQITEAYEREVSSRIIGEMVMERLKTLDAVAYVRFASVYREFKDVSDFVEELKSMRPQNLVEIMEIEQGSAVRNNTKYRNANFNK